MSTEVKRCASAAWCALRRYSYHVYDRPTTAVASLKVRFLRAQICEIFAQRMRDVVRLPEGIREYVRTQHPRLVVSYDASASAKKKKTTNHLLSHRAALERSGCEGIETTVRRPRLPFAGSLRRMGEQRSPKRFLHAWQRSTIVYSC